MECAMVSWIPCGEPSKMSALSTPQSSTLPAREPCPSPSAPAPDDEPVLCHHCGRTASNGISCQGFCVADSGY
ncbi:conserved hypothetical protein [Cyanobium sp. PCC 7001]|nr:conserved hypothetical protein [Cyanobium sp. PCC 7001]